MRHRGKRSRSVTAWTETLLHSFKGDAADWGLPNGVVLGPDGVLYGTAMGANGGRGCDDGCGSVFQLLPLQRRVECGQKRYCMTSPEPLPAMGTNLTQRPYSDPEECSTAQPSAVEAPAMERFSRCYPPSSPGGTWTEVILHSFSGGADGTFPISVTLGPDGNLYGTTNQGGAPKDGVHNQGTVFQLVLQ